MAKFKGIWLLCLASWCTAFQSKYESFCSLQIVLGRYQLWPCDKLVGQSPHTSLFCLELRGGQGVGQGEKKQRSEGKANKSTQKSSYNKTFLKKSDDSAKNFDAQADVPHSNKLKSESEDDISNPISESELDFSKLTLKV